jgi:hypothetical protein
MAYLFPCRGVLFRWVRFHPTKYSPMNEPPNHTGMRSKKYGACRLFIFGSLGHHWKTKIIYDSRNSVRPAVIIFFTAYALSFGGCSDLFSSDEQVEEETPITAQSQLFAPPPNPRHSALEHIEFTQSHMRRYFAAPRIAKGATEKACHFPSTLGWDNRWSAFEPYVATPGDGCVQIKVISAGIDGSATTTIYSRYRKHNCQGDWVHLKQTFRGRKSAAKNICKMVETSPPVELQPGTEIP